jgi:hypothetical protein
MKRGRESHSNPVVRFFVGLLRCQVLIIALTVCAAVASAGELVLYNLSNGSISFARRI